MSDEMERYTVTERRRHGPDLFFPLALIVAGVVWMLVNAGTIPAENILRLVPYWPVLLIAGGISLILGRVHWVLSALVWLGVAALALWLVVAPTGFLPQPKAAEVQHRSLNTPIEGARSADVTLDLSIYTNRIFALPNSDDNLLQAEIDYTGDIRYEASGSGTSKTIRLGTAPVVGFNLPMAWMTGQNLQWEIGLSPRVPMRLDIDNSTGSTEADLSALQLESLNINGGTGSMNITLPEDSPSFPFDLDVSTGSVNIEAPEGSAFNLTVDGGTGSLTLDLPDDAGIQVEVTSGGTGSLNLPGGFDKVSGDPNDDEGVWENAAFAGADAPITIELDISTGSVNVR